MEKRILLLLPSTWSSQNAAVRFLNQRAGRLVRHGPYFLIAPPLKDLQPRKIRPQGTALFVPPERQRQQQAAQKSGHNPAQVQH